MTSAPIVNIRPQSRFVGNALEAQIIERIRQSGPVSFRQFMEWALYDPKEGYYARATRRSGRRGDFFTSVDVGPLFGELLESQFAEMWSRLEEPRPFTVVEAAAGDGRLAADVLAAARARDPSFYHALHMSLVEPSPVARRPHGTRLASHAGRWSSHSTLPTDIYGVIFANELIDALPFHRVRQTVQGLREILVEFNGHHLIEIEAEPTTPQLERYLERVGAKLEPGWEAEVNLEALAWIAAAGAALTRGFVLVIDYGDEASHLYSARHATGTARAFRAHALQTSLIARPGAQDITANVDFTSIRNAALDAGLEPLELLDQTYFCLGLVGTGEHLASGPPDDLTSLRRRLALKTLIAPSGLGGSHKVLILGKHVGGARLRAASFARRMT